MSWARYNILHFPYFKNTINEYVSGICICPCITTITAPDYKVFIHLHFDFYRYDLYIGFKEV